MIDLDLTSFWLGAAAACLAITLAVLAPVVWHRWRERGEPAPLADWTAGRRVDPGRGDDGGHLRLRARDCAARPR